MGGRGDVSLSSPKGKIPATRPSRLPPRLLSVSFSKLTVLGFQQCPIKSRNGATAGHVVGHPPDSVASLWQIEHETAIPSTMQSSLVLTTVMGWIGFHDGKYVPATPSLSAWQLVSRSGRSNVRKGRIGAPARGGCSRNCSAHGCDFLQRACTPWHLRFATAIRMLKPATHHLTASRPVKSRVPHFGWVVC